MESPRPSCSQPIEPCWTDRSDTPRASKTAGRRSWRNTCGLRSKPGAPPGVCHLWRPVMKSRIALLLPASFLVLFVHASPASAQLRQGTVEINGFGGWLFGGEIAHSHDIVTGDFDHGHVDVGDDAAYGGRIG